MNLIEQIEQIRRQKKLNKKEFAKKLGMSPQRYNNYIKQKRKLPASLLVSIHDVYGINIDSLIKSME